MEKMVPGEVSKDQVVIISARPEIYWDLVRGLVLGAGRGLSRYHADFFSEGAVDSVSAFPDVQMNHSSK
jgi:hypothetical protein